MDFDRNLILGELEFKTARSGGSGGQHVNKVSSKVLLSWDLWNSAALSSKQKALLTERLSSRLTKLDVLQLEVSEDRSQLRNKHIAIQRFLDILEKGLKTNPIRKKTKTPKSVILARMDRKKKMAQKKAQRRWRPDES